MVENEERWPSNFRAGEYLELPRLSFTVLQLSVKSAVGFPEKQNIFFLLIHKYLCNIPIHAIFFQVMESLALADLKKRNAAKLDAKNQEQLLEMGREVPGEIKPQEGKNFDAFHS